MDMSMQNFMYQITGGFAEPGQSRKGTKQTGENSLFQQMMKQMIDTDQLQTKLEEDVSEKGLPVQILAAMQTNTYQMFWNSGEYTNEVAGENHCVIPSDIPQKVSDFPVMQPCSSGREGNEHPLEIWKTDFVQNNSYMAETDTEGAYEENRRQDWGEFLPEIKSIDSAEETVTVQHEKGSEELVLQGTDSRENRVDEMEMLMAGQDTEGIPKVLEEEMPLVNQERNRLDMNRADSLEQIAKLIDRASSSKEKNIEILLEPEHLGKLSIKTTYSDGSTTVLITCDNEKTLETLSQCVKELAQLLQNRTGEQTTVFVEQPEKYQEQYPEHEQSSKEHSGKEKRKRNRRNEEENDFLQQLRLGMV